MSGCASGCRRLNGGDRDATNQILVAAGLDNRLPDDFDRLQDAALGIRMGRKYDGIAGFDRDDGFEQCGRGGIGGGGQSGDYTDRDRERANSQGVIA